MTLYIITVFVALLRRDSHIGLYVRNRRQTQAHLSGHLLLGRGNGRRRDNVHQNRRILSRAENRKSGAEIFGRHGQLLRVHAPVHRPLRRHWGKAMRCTNRIFSSESSLRTRRTGRTNFFHRPISAISRDAATRTAFAT